MTYIVLFAWFSIWAWLLRDGLHRETMPEMFGSTKIARVVWVAASVLFNPLAAILYVLFVRYGLLAANKLKDVLVVGGLGAIAWLQFGVGTPISPDWSDDVAGFGFGLGVHTSTTNSSMISSQSDQERPVALSHVRILHDDNPVVAIAARQLARDFDALPFVHEVDCHPFSHEFVSGARGADFYVQLDAHALSNLAIPFYQRIAGPITLTAGQAPGPNGYTYSPHRDIRVGYLQFDGTLDFRFHRYGTALGSTVYGDPAKSVHGWLHGALIEGLTEYYDENGSAQSTPAGYEFREVSPPESVRKRDTRVVVAECVPLIHNRTTWTFDDPRPTPVVLDELIEELEVDSWRRVSVGTNDPEEAIEFMRRGDERMWFSRWPPKPRATTFPRTFDPDSEPEEITEPDHGFAIRYEMWFDAEGIARVRDEACVAGAPLPTFLMFRSHLTDAQRALMFETLDANPTPRASRWRLLAEMCDKADKGEQARDACALAWMLAQTHNVDSSERKRIEKLGKRLGIEPAEKSLETLGRAGYVAVEPDGEQERHFDVEFGEAAWFATKKPDSPIVTCRLSLIGSSDEPRFAYEVRSEGGSTSSTRMNSIPIEGHTDFGSLTGFNGTYFSVACERLEGNRFRFFARVR